MKRIFLIGILGLGFLKGRSQQNHVLLISIDGLRPDFYLQDQWNTPNLKKLRDQGVYADGVQSVVPTVTYPSHTSIITGAFPGHHGIYYNVPYGNKDGHWYWEASYIKTPTLWDAVQQKHLSSGAVMWPVTVGAPINYNFPVRRADNDEKTDQYSVTRPFMTPKGFDQEIEDKATGKLSQADFNGDNTIDITTEKMASYILRTYRPNLMAIHFTTVDHAQHGHGRQSVQTQQAIHLVDSTIGLLLKTLDQSGLRGATTVIVTGDHGFVDTKEAFAPNTLLAAQHLMDKGAVKARFNSAGGMAFLYLTESKDQTTLSQVIKALQGLSADERSRFRIVYRDELDKMGANPEVALALAMRKETVAIGDNDGELIRVRKGQGGNHGYFPDFDEIRTGFIAQGYRVADHKMIKGLRLVDISPIIAQLLQLDFKAPDGKYVPGIIKE